METDTLVIILTEQLTALRQKLIQAENDIIENKSKGNTKEGLNSKLTRDVKQMTEQNTALMREIQEITQKKDKLEHQFSRLD
jgi:predicted  nucleic acid-binding Zn-ribbon protein